MAKKSMEGATHNLVQETGIGAADLLCEKVVNPDFSLALGSLTITEVLHIEHMGDGQPVITLMVTPPEHTLTLQFEASARPFRETVIDKDGRLLFQNVSEA